MPSYELSVIYKVLERPILCVAIRRTVDAILERGGVIRSFENVGVRKLPYKMFKHASRNDEGHYYLMEFDSPPGIISDLKAQLNLDLEIIKPTVLRTEEMASRPCEHRDCDFGELTEESRDRLRADIENFVKKL